MPSQFLSYWSLRFLPFPSYNFCLHHHSNWHDWEVLPKGAQAHPTGVMATVQKHRCPKSMSFTMRSLMTANHSKPAFAVHAITKLESQPEFFNVSPFYFSFLFLAHAWVCLTLCYNCNEKQIYAHNLKYICGFHNGIFLGC